MRKPGAPPTTDGAIKDRDMRSPAMENTWRAVQRLGLAIQMHFIPFYAPRIGALAEQFREMPVILDHLARAGEGTPAEYDEVLKLARLGWLLHEPWHRSSGTNLLKLMPD